MKAQLIKIARDDDAAQIIGQMRRAESETLVLYIPSAGYRIAKNALNFELLRNETDILGKDVYLASEDSEIKQMAADNGFYIISPDTLNENEKTESDKVPEENSEEKKQELINQLYASYEKPVKLSEVLGKKRNIFIRLITALIVIGALSGGIWYAGAKILPRAVIEISLEKSSRDFEVLVRFNKNIAEARLASSSIEIPMLMSLLEKNMTKEFSSSGVSSKPTYAKGTVTIYNDQKEAQILVARTRLESPDGKIFRIQERVTISAKGSVETSVVAENPGEDYNISATQFTIPGLKNSSKYALVYAKSSVPTAGGSSNGGYFATKDDALNAETELIRALRDAIALEAKLSAPPGYVLLDANLEPKLNKIKISETNQNSKSFTASLSGSTTKIYYNKETLEKNLKDYAVKTLDINNEILDIAIQNSKILSKDIDSGIINASLAATIKSQQRLDIKSLTAKLLGTKEADSENTINDLAGITAAKIKLWPFWVKTIPNSGKKVKIIAK